MLIERASAVLTRATHVHLVRCVLIHRMGESFVWIVHAGHVIMSMIRVAASKFKSHHLRSYFPND